MRRDLLRVLSGDDGTGDGVDRLPPVRPVRPPSYLTWATILGSWLARLADLRVAVFR